ncbi:NAD-dependent dehydratase [Longimycelium tulufanense]|uniref:NAD-dependent dehydratase n=1 Tax=Longimycelium tulufanense TaxID=907463 RepID=A0A8J3C7Q3_9PSEU|nr:SDR family oxidoreductase [Longimycelium tulufanense]GGM50818.1 NAD-dependent dehydratase [Longimycelium tulufanense]
MRVLLTGHQGYLGSVMAPALVAAGHEVVGLDSGLFAHCVLGPAPTDPPGFAVDIRDATGDVMSGIDAVIHLAALSNDPLGSIAPEVTHAINHTATTHLARLAKHAGVPRFLYASTCSVYGAAGDELVAEDAPLRPVTPYAESKIQAEEDLLGLADENFSPVFLRNATAFGASPRPRADIVVNNLVGVALLTGEVRVLSDGTPWRPLVHAADIAQAFVAALSAPREVIHGQAFNVGWEVNNLTIADIAKYVVDAVPGATLRITGETGPDKRSYRVAFDRIHRLLPDYQPRWTVPDGVVELVDHYAQHGLTEEAFTRRFVRLAVLSERTAAGEVAADMRVVRARR